MKQLPGVSEIVPTKKCIIISSLLSKRKHENPPHHSNTPNTCARHQTSRIWAVLWINHSQMKAKRNLLQGIIQDHKCSDSPRFQGPPRDPVSSTKSCHCAPLLFHTPPCLDRFSNRFGDWPRGPGETSKNHGIFFRCGNVHQVSPPKKQSALLQHAFLRALQKSSPHRPAFCGIVRPMIHGEANCKAILGRGSADIP